MSLDIEQQLRVFFASAPQTIHSIQTLEISHSDMTETFCIWRETLEGEITTEAGVQTVLPVNFEIRLAGTEAHLDQNFQIKLDTVDIEDQFRQQLDLIPLDTPERIRVVYREYLSDDLTEMVAGPAVLQVEGISYQVGAATITAVSPRLNMLRTGDLYAPRDIPMLRGFL